MKFYFIYFIVRISTYLSQTISSTSLLNKIDGQKKNKTV